MLFSTLAIVSAIFIPALSVAAEPKTHYILMKDAPFGLPRFEPSSLDINVGDTVIWTNKGIFPHTVDEGKNCLDLLDPQVSTNTLRVTSTPRVSSGPVPPFGGTFMHKFEKAGEFPYFCLPHCLPSGTMTGTVIVKENPTSNA
ncbi:MAG: Cupredoxin [Linnemannia gamsii]|nr:MAG: Cupredoxin [Linnemannia gamsii]